MYSWNNKPVGPLSGLFVEPREDGSFVIGQHWLVWANNARWFSIEVQGIVELSKLIKEWINAPEEVMQKRFGWTYNEFARNVKEEISKKKVDLSFLDLEL